MVLPNITVNRLLKMGISCVRVNDSYLDMEFIPLQILMSRPNTLPNLVSMEIITESCFKIELFQIISLEHSKGLYLYAV